MLKRIICRIRQENLLILFPAVLLLFVTWTGLPRARGADLAQNERIDPADGAVQVYVPGGEFVMGADEPDSPYADEQRPPHPVKLKGFWIDKYEVTNEQFAGFLNKLLAGQGPVAKMHKFSKDCNPRQVHDMFRNRVKFDHPFCGLEVDIDQRVVRVKPGWEKIPVMPVSWQGANEYCKTMGKRLLTEAEWEYAAGGAEHFKYPWGNEWRRTWANVATGKPTRIGSYPKDISPFGVMDMAGNVREWVQDKFDMKYYSESPRENPVNRAGDFAYIERVIRGGCYVFTEWDSRTTSRHYFYAPGSPMPVATGVRCAESGPPPTQSVGD